MTTDDLTEFQALRMAKKAIGTAIPKGDHRFGAQERAEAKALAAVGLKIIRVDGKEIKSRKELIYRQQVRELQAKLFDVNRRLMQVSENL